MFRTLGLAAALSLLPCALPAQSNLPAAADLIRRADAADKSQNQRNEKYTYREDHTQSDVDKNGNLSPRETRTYEHIMLEGEEYKKLVLIDDKPLDAKTQKRVDEDLEKTRAERRKRGLFHIERTVALSDLEQLGRLFDNKVAGEETVLGRRTWRVDSEPKPGYKPANQNEQEVLAARHTSWFDQQEGMRIKWHDEFIRAAKGFQPGTTVDFELTRIGDSWLTDNIAFRGKEAIVLGIKAPFNSLQRYYDYKRFTVDSTLTPQ